MSKPITSGTKNRDRKQYINKWFVARNFIKQLATDSDLAELLSLISDRQLSLKENEKQK